MTVAEVAAADTREGVTTQISYLTYAPAHNRRFAAPGIEKNTGRYDVFPMRVGNARPNAKSFTLDTHGFTLADHKSAVKNFFDNDEVGKIYPAEVAEMVKKLTGASRVATQGWMVRTSADTSKFKQKTANYSHQGGVQPPAADAHVDYLPDIADRVAKDHYERAFPDGPGYRRFIAGSFWRTFSEPPQDWPLALCDGKTVGPDEGVKNTLIVVDKIPDEAGMLAPIADEDRRPSAAVFRYNPKHRWWYFPNMNRDEVLFFKFHDSDRSKAWRVPHTAFLDPSAKNAHARESIEMRCIAFFD